VTALAVAHSKDRTNPYVDGTLSAKVKLTADANTHYFVAMQSGGAAKYGDSVYYNVTLNNLTSGSAGLAMPETDSSISFAQDDVLAGHSSLRDASPAFAGSVPDPLEKLPAESAAGYLASL